MKVTNNYAKLWTVGSLPGLIGRSLYSGLMFSEQTFASARVTSGPPQITKRVFFCIRCLKGNLPFRNAH
ncbi:hypothetical protein GDO81_019982 [Engystomops pustulosus]|uniref:Uncharacterized protein n=1 Tax=Engystomops pustulosus TaxID=76066 RepID=A0AAV6Z950_ENGPU|nr:hypothetical protein GDO81_019982 [Engystomops pustulosus]